MYKRKLKDKAGLTTLVLSIIVIVVIVIACIGVVVAWSYFEGDNSEVYVPPADPGYPIIGYVSASVGVDLDNRALFGGLVVRFAVDSLAGELQGTPTGGAQVLKMFDIWSHDVSGYVKFQLTNPGFNYDTGKQKALWSGNVGGGGLTTLTVDWPNGPAIRHHGTYALSVYLYDNSNNLLDQQTANIDL